MPPAVELTTQHLYGKDDRYLMIVAVLLLIFGGAAVIKYLVKHLDRMQTRAESHTEQLIQVAVTGQSIADSCRASIDANTKVLERVDIKLRERQ
jgi:hypothetical protein